jgi:hypothetical protein
MFLDEDMATPVVPASDSDASDDTNHGAEETHTEETHTEEAAPEATPEM